MNGIEKLPMIDNNYYYLFSATFINRSFEWEFFIKSKIFDFNLLEKENAAN